MSAATVLRLWRQRWAALQRSSLVCLLMQCPASGFQLCGRLCDGWLVRCYWRNDCQYILADSIVIAGLSAGIILLMSALILMQTSAIVRGGETNYIMATYSLY